MLRKKTLVLHSKHAAYHCAIMHNDMLHIACNLHAIGRSVMRTGSRYALLKTLVLHWKHAAYHCAVMHNDMLHISCNLHAIWRSVMRTGLRYTSLKNTCIAFKTCSISLCCYAQWYATHCMQFACNLTKRNVNQFALRFVKTRLFCN